ncbi:hypothetical protein Tco_0988701 [Tanacetum coccineum]|uniref:Uncharacterized protein n=1 Tax=Tanacetum coccineum TaxID=301880 RepID=A0ABQ5ESY4_9ASTR
MIAYALCWGLNIDIVGILYDDLISKLTAGGKKGREKNICYTEYLFLVIEHLLGEAYVNKDLFPIKFYQITSVTFKQSSSSEVPLTSHMREIAKLSEEANIEDTGDKSLSGTAVHPTVVFQTPTPQASESQSADIPEVPADITNQSLEASKSAEEQVNQPQTAYAEKVQENIGTKADESPYDTKSEIKFMKRFKPLHADDEPQITFIGSEKPDEEEDSNMESLPDDDVGSMSGSQSLEKELSKSEKRDADELIDEMTELNASADKPSDPLSLLQSLFIKVDQLEPNITKKVFKELQTSVPSSVSTALKETLPVLLADALKDALPSSSYIGRATRLHDLQANEQTILGFQQTGSQKICSLTKRAQQSNSNTDRKEGQSKVRTGLNKVTKRLDSLLNSTKDNFNDVSDLKQQIKDLVSLLKSAKVIKETKLEGRSKENPEQLEGVNAQGEQEKENPEQPIEVNVQVE